MLDLTEQIIGISAAWFWGGFFGFLWAIVERIMRGGRAGRR